MHAIGLDNLRLELNSLGTAVARSAYRSILTKYFRSRVDELDRDSRDRLGRNPLRILDSKNPQMSAIIAEAPSIAEHLDEESQLHFDQLCELLTTNNIDFELNPTLVRGLDYYSRTVFEWITSDLGAQGTVCAGGRYDDLIELFGGKPMPAVGFAMGIERVIELKRAEGPNKPVAPDLYVMATSLELDIYAASLAESLRKSFPRWRISFHVGGGSLKSRMKKADRSGARLALILGEDEHANDEVTVKPLRTDDRQSVYPRHALATELPRLLTR